MVAPYNPPAKGEDFICRIALTSANDARAFKASPTIAAGDFKVDKDGAGLANLATLPTVDPAGSVLVKVSLSAAEMGGDVVTLVCIDQTTPKEWADLVISIPTTA